MKSLLTLAAVFALTTTARAEEPFRPKLTAVPEAKPVESKSAQARRAVEEENARRETPWSELTPVLEGKSVKSAAVINPVPLEVAHLECFVRKDGRRSCYIYVVNGCGLASVDGVRMNLIEQGRHVNNGPEGFLQGVVICKSAIPSAPAPTSPKP